MRDLPPAIDCLTAQKLEALALDFPEAALREVYIQPEVDGIRMRLTLVIVKLVTGQIRIKSGATE